MGNCCRRNSYSKLINHDDPVIQTSANEVECNKTDFLETFLNDVYEKECVIRATANEVEFIKTGIESLAEEMVKSSKETTQQQNTSSVAGDSTSELSFVKVGSFYEGTKNTFPNEFDLIFLDQPSDINHTIENLYKNLIRKFDKSLKYTDIVDSQTTRELYFNQYIGENGPAYTSQFIYRNEFGYKRCIHLDLVPAVRHVVNETNRDEFTRYVHEQCVSLDSFRDEILKAGNYLEIAGDEYFAYTETEVHFLKNVLSRKHVKVYRILKFIINGHGDEKLLEAYLKLIGEKNIYSSYRLKVNMFYHHDKCENANDEKLGDCVIQILNKMLKQDLMDPKSTVVCLPIHLKFLTMHLEIMQYRVDSYAYERTWLPSVPTLYLLTLHKKDNRHILWFKFKDWFDGRKPSHDSFITKFDIPQNRNNIYVEKKDFSPRLHKCLFPILEENIFLQEPSIDFQRENPERCNYIVNVDLSKHG